MRKIVLLWLLLASPMLLADSLDQKFKFWAALQQAGENENGPLRYWLEAQGRFGDQPDLFEVGLLRMALGWPQQGAFSFWLGFDYLPELISENDDNTWTNERRLWQQVLWQGSVKKIATSAHIRLEERAHAGESEIAFRSRQQIELVFNNMKFFDKFIPVVREEVFFNLNNADWVSSKFISQNRLFLGANIDTKTSYRWQVGYLNQTFFANNVNDLMNHTLYVSLLF